MSFRIRALLLLRCRIEKGGYVLRARRPQDVAHALRPFLRFRNRPGFVTPKTSIGDQHEWLRYAMPTLQPGVLGT